MPWDRELRVLEQAIQRLSAAYDAFLYGSVSKPPIEIRKHVEEMIRRLSSSEGDSSADRYRFSTLQSRYYALCERVERLMAEKEAGRRPVHFRPETSTSSNAQAPSSVSVAGEVEREADPYRGLFERYLAAKRKRGEDVSNYRFEGFRESLEKEREKLRERLGADIEFEVTERFGSVKLVAKKKERGDRPQSE